MYLACTSIEREKPPTGFSLVEVMIAVFVVGILTLALFLAFSTGLLTVKSARDNLRATQILVQKMETIRLLTWTQLTNTAVAPSTFVDWYDPSGTNGASSGTMYRGLVQVTNAPATIPGAYRDNMRSVTVTLFWTNHITGSNRRLLQTRQAQTLVARFGMQDYVY